MNIEALHDYVIVRPASGETKTDSGIVLAASGNDKKTAIRGEVLAAGPGRWADRGFSIIPMAVKVGDSVLFDNTRSQAFAYDGEVLQMMRQECVFARTPHGA